MKFFLRISIFSFFLVLLTNIAWAQDQLDKTNYIVVKSKNSIRQTGLLAEISETGITVVNNKGIKTSFNYPDIKKIKIIQKHNDAVYSIVTGGLAIGAIASAVSTNDGNAAAIIGVGGTLGVLTLSMLLHNAIHPPVLKLSSEAINYSNVKNKLANFVLTTSK